MKTLVMNMVAIPRIAPAGLQCFIAAAAPAPATAAAYIGDFFKSPPTPPPPVNYPVAPAIAVFGDFKNRRRPRRRQLPSRRTRRRLFWRF